LAALAQKGCPVSTSSSAWQIAWAYG